MHDLGKFIPQNEIAKKLVEEFGYLFLDFATPLMDRRDGHVGHKYVDSTHHLLTGFTDCLQYFLPRLSDVWVEIMYNVLLQQFPAPSIREMAKERAASSFNKL